MYAALHPACLPACLPRLTQRPAAGALENLSHGECHHLVAQHRLPRLTAAVQLQWSSWMDGFDVAQLRLEAGTQSIEVSMP